MLNSSLLKQPHIKTFSKSGQGLTSKCSRLTSFANWSTLMTFHSVTSMMEFWGQGSAGSKQDPCFFYWKDQFKRTFFVNDALIFKTPCFLKWWPISDFPFESQWNSDRKPIFLELTFEQNITPWHQSSGVPFLIQQDNR